MPSGLTAIKEEEKLGSEPPIPFTSGIQAVESAMVIEIENGISNDNPKTLAQVMERPDCSEWKKAMKEELDLMAKYEVWDMVNKPEDTNIVGSRWVFCIK